MHSLFRDISLALRSLSRSPSYASVALVTLALGIGATTAVFSVVRGVLLRPLPYPEPDELVRVWELNQQGGRMDVAWTNFMDWRDAPGFEDMGVYAAGTSTVLGAGEPMRLGTAAVSHGFFQTLGLRPVLGRVPLPAEHAAGAEPVAVVSEGFWRTTLGRTRDLSSVRINVSGFDVRVVGVMPAALERPVGTEIWYPVELEPVSVDRTAHNYSVVARLADGVTLERADEQLDVITAAFLEEDAVAAEGGAVNDFYPRSVVVEPLLETLVADSRPTLWVLLAAAGMLLLVACTNLASMALARGASRDREVALRRALGAGRAQVIRLLFVESALLALAGGALGVAIASATVAMVRALAPSGLPRSGDIRIDAGVLAFALVAAVLTSLVFGLVPALRGSAPSLESVLRSGGGRGSSSRGHERLWSGLVVTEVALSLLLLTGAGLLIRSLGAVLSTDPGFRTEGVVLATISPPPAKYGDGDARATYYERLLESVRAVPGVEAAGLSGRPPLLWAPNGLVDIADGPKPEVSGTYQVVDDAYFRVLDIPRLHGRLFDTSDRPDGEHVVVVSRSFAELAWPGDDPLGKRMTAGGMDNYWNQDKWATVIGVVGDIRQRSLTAEPEPTYYFPLSQRPYRTWSATVLVRPGVGDGSRLIPTLRSVIREVDPDVPASLTTMERQVAGSVGEQRFATLVLGLFAAVGLVLAVVGIYGVVSYTVVRRTREMGIRIALGARPESVQGMMQRRSLALTGLGLVLGIVAALGATRVLGSLLHGVSPTDPVTFAATGLLLTAAALLAGWIPARRTARIDPMITMQAE